jgi:hypothetical protein
MYLQKVINKKTLKPFFGDFKDATKIFSHILFLKSFPQARYLQSYGGPKTCGSCGSGLLLTKVTKN